MSELGEMVSAAAAVDSGWTCPFAHRPVPDNKTNYMPPPKTNNDAGLLSDNLDDESKSVATIPIQFQHNGKQCDEDVQFTAHHLVPGNEAWPASALYKWVDHRGDWIRADIGYNVNAASNGVDLPGHTAASSWSNPMFQQRYAFGAMVADTKRRQFHDRHAAYSDFVVKALDKIASKLEVHDMPGCGKENCQGMTQKKYAPPYDLLPRLNAVAMRLEGKLTGDCRKWKAPIMTSRFALMLKSRGLSQSQARELLRRDQFDYGAD